MKDNIDFALHYAGIGLSVFPCHSIKNGECTCKKQDCSKKGKHPLTYSGFKDASKDVSKIKSWWTEYPEANIGCATGAMSGIVVLDLDTKGGKSVKETMAIMADSGFHIPPTACSITGAYLESRERGSHFFFKYPGVSVITSSDILKHIEIKNVDIRGDKGYVILPPSNHFSAVSYEWKMELEQSVGSVANIAEMPDWLIKLSTTKNTDKKWKSGLNGVNEGSRNDTATSMAGKILSNLSVELQDTIGWNSLRVWNLENPKPLNENELRSVFDSVKKYHVEGADKVSRISKADSVLNEILSRKDIVLFHDEQGDGYISLDIAGHQEIRPIGGKVIRNWLSKESYQIQKKALGATDSSSIVSVLEGKACFEGEEIELQNRASFLGEDLWYDLTNNKWQAVKICKTGWEVVDKPPIIFRRYSHHKAQVYPMKNGDPSLFLNYVNIVNPEHRLLLLVFLVTSFVPNFPHVMLVVFGSQGSSKSTLSRLIRLICDPSLIETASFPSKNNELVQALAHHYFLFFDNVSHINEEQSDTLCKAVTGGGHTKRALFLNDDDIIYSFKRCIGINGINLVTTRPDLLERSLLIELERIDPSHRKTEKELYENFAKDLPLILGGVFDVLVKAIQIRPTIKLDSHPRMADWALWGCAVAEALGYTKEEFMSAYKNNIERQTEMLVNENIVATAVIAFMDGKNEWRGRPSELFETLTNNVEFDGIDTKHEKYWPKGANSLSRRLNELSTPLKQVGILITISTTGIERYIHIVKSKVEQKDGTDDTDSIWEREVKK